MHIIIPRSIMYVAAISLSALVLHLTCNTLTEVPPQTLADLCQIHLQAWFSRTPAEVTIDRSQVFADTVTTGSILAFAAIIPLHVSKDTHELNVTVADSVSRDTTFTIADTLYIGVNYDATNSRITYVFQRRPFRYR